MKVLNILKFLQYYLNNKFAKYFSFLNKRTAKQFVRTLDPEFEIQAKDVIDLLLLAICVIIILGAGLVAFTFA